MNEEPHYSHEKLDELISFVGENSVPQIHNAKCTYDKVVMSYDSKLPIIFDLETRVSSLPTSDKTIHANVSALAISECGKYAVTGHQDGQIVFWDVVRRKAVTETTICKGVAVNSLSFMNGWNTLAAVFANGEIHQIEISNLLLFLFLKPISSHKMDRVGTRIQSVCSCDSSISLMAVSCGDSIEILDADFKRVTSFETKSSIFALSNEDWHFYFAVAENAELVVYRILENGKSDIISKSKFMGHVTDIGFITTRLIAASTSDSVTIVNVNEGVVARYTDITNRPAFICGSSGRIFFPPNGMITIETIYDRIKRLVDDGKVLEAIDSGVAAILGELPGFDCCQDQQKLQKTLKEIILTRVKIDDSNVAQIAESVTNADLCESNDTFLSDLCRTIETDDLKIQFLLMILQTDGLRPDVISKILREIASVEPIANKTVEDALMNAHFTPSFIQEAVAIGRTLHFPRFIVSLFDRVYNDILPAFGLIVDTGSKDDIIELCEYVFMSDTFEHCKSNPCLVWLHAPNSGRLAKVVNVNVPGAKRLVEEFLSRAPVKFGLAQSLEIQDIIRSVFACFEHMEAPDGDELFTLVAEKSISERIKIPSAALPSVISYLFASSAPRTIRENLFLRTVDIDYPEIDVRQFQKHCVKAGFSCVLQRLLHGDEELMLQLQCRLLSDHPDDAFTLLESPIVSKDNAQDSLLLLFKPFLYYDARKTVMLIHDHFPALHPSQILSLQCEEDKKLYFDTLFSIDPPIVVPEDTKSYLQFLKDHQRYMIDFLWNTKNISHEQAYDFCDAKHLYIGCALLSCKEGFYSRGFDAYQNHVQRGGMPDHRLMMVFLENIEKIEAHRYIVYRTLIEPHAFHEDPGNLDSIKMIVDRAIEAGDKTEVISAVYSIYLMCAQNNPAKNLLYEYMKKNTIIIDKTMTQGLVMDILRTMPYNCKNDLFSDSEVSIVDYSSGVTVVSSKVNTSARAMSEFLSEKVHSLVQHVELCLMIRNINIPQEQEVIVIVDSIASRK